MAESEETEEEKREEGAWFHRHRHHPHLTVDLLFGLPQTNPQENLNMAETTLSITPDITVVDGALGAVHDAQGNLNTKDLVVSGSWSVSDAALGSVVTPDTDPTGITAALTLLGVEGSLGVAFTGTSQSGATVTGKGTVDIAAGPPATVILNLTVPAPVVPVPVPVPVPAA